MKPIPHRNISQFSSVDPDLEPYQWAKLADYSDSSFLNFYFYAKSDRSLLSDFDTGRVASRNTIAILGVTAALFLLGSALWCRSVELHQPYPIFPETMEVGNAAAVNSLFN